MTWRDIALLAARNAGRRPGRVALTVLAIALATTLLTALVTIARTAETRVLDQVADGGPVSGITVLPAAPSPDQLDQDVAAGGEFRAIDEQTITAISDLELVRAVLPAVSAPVLVITPDRRVDGSELEPFTERLVGVDTAQPGLIPVTPVAGRLPAPGSEVDVAVTEAYLRRLGLDRTEAEQVLGTEIEVGAGRVVDGVTGTAVEGRWRRLQIVGVVAQGAGSGQLVVSVELARADLAWTKSGVDAGREFEVSESDYSGLFVVARGIGQVGPTREAIAALGYASSAPENLITSVENYLGVVEIVLGAVGLIALVVAALGIANALIASVRERRREIGVLKAIGARDRDVLRLFVIEAAVLGLVGGVVGTVLGILTSRLVAAVVNGYLAGEGLAGIQPVLPIEVVVGGVVGPTVIAVLGGIGPAWQASRLSPREAIAAA